MKPYGNKFSFKKNFSYQSQKNAEKKSILNLKLVHQIFNTINFSFLFLISILFFLSFDSQRKWSNTYKTLSRTKSMNNNLIDYISKTEEFYINKLEKLSNFKKTKPKDLIYLEKIAYKKQNYLKKKFNILIEGLDHSRFQKGY